MNTERSDSVGQDKAAEQENRAAELTDRVDSTSPDIPSQDDPGPAMPAVDDENAGRLPGSE